jgi:hypothetical protein
MGIEGSLLILYEINDINLNAYEPGENVLVFPGNIEILTPGGMVGFPAQI